MLFRLRAVAVGLLAGLLVAGLPVRQTSGQQNRGGQASRPYVNPLGVLLPWLGYPQVQSELELVDEQIEKLNTLRDEIHNEIRGLVKLIPADRAGDWQAEYVAAQRRIAQRAEKGIADILLTHQLERIHQIARQQQFRATGYGAAGPLIHGEIAQALGISEQQRTRLLVKQKEVQRDIHEKTRVFRAQIAEESREALLDVLTDTQRARLEQILGEPFELQPVVPQK